MNDNETLLLGIGAYHFSWCFNHLVLHQANQGVLRRHEAAPRLLYPYFTSSWFGCQWRAVGGGLLVGDRRQRNAQIVVGDEVYTFVGQPWDAVEFPEALPGVERLWNAATESIAFFD